MASIDLQNDVHRDAQQLVWALDQAARLRGFVTSRLRAATAVHSLAAAPSPLAAIRMACDLLELQAPVSLPKPDLSHGTMVALVAKFGWGVVVGCTAQGLWKFRCTAGDFEVPLTNMKFVARAGERQSAGGSVEGPGATLKSALLKHKGTLFEGVLATVAANALALGTSMFSMQVYDRVIPTSGISTLMVLLIGVLIAITIEATLKFARARIMDEVVIGVDATMAREIFTRLLSIRLDQMPSSVGTLASQLRSYEQIRAMLTARVIYAFVEVPLAAVFLVMIGVIGSPVIAAVPVVVAIFAVLIGVVVRRRIEEAAQGAANISNHRMGLLVEAVEGAETIKAGAGGWKFLARWVDTCVRSMRSDLRIQHTNESLTHVGSFLQQAGYCAMVSIGALEAMAGNISPGAVLACSILSGRVISPILALPGYLVQHAHANAALKGLNMLYSLETDSHGVEIPLVPQRINGKFCLKDVEFSYPESRGGISVSELRIRPGERVGIVGAIGSGKSTLLRILAGLYRPHSGSVLVDGLDVAQISREVICRDILYMQQDHRLFAGTLRENLLIGLPDPGDDVICVALKRSGLSRLVASHPRGVDLMIREGGTGLSGGQRQLVAFTRLLLASPSIMLLDEPTSSMDQSQERRCLSVMTELLSPDRTLVVATHKPAVLRMVDRLIVVSDGRIAMDGPRDAILKRLAQSSASHLNPVPTNDQASVVAVVPTAPPVPQIVSTNSRRRDNSPNQASYV